MKISEISLPSTKGFRPKPIIKSTHDGRILIIVTIWGDSSVGEQVTSSLLKKLENTEEVQQEESDPDVTRFSIPIEVKIQKKNQEALFQEALQKINHFLLTEVNKEKWITCAEILLIGYDQQYFYWAQAGQPQIFRSTESGVEPLSYIPDMTVDMDQYVPLPFHALGLEKNVQIQTGMIPFGKTQQLILLSTPRVPGGLYITMGINLGAIAELIQQSFPDSPAWAGVIDFQAL